MKNLRYFLLALLFVISSLLAIPIQATGSMDANNVEAMIDYLSGIGIPEEYLETLMPADIMEMYDRYYGKEIIFETLPAVYLTESYTSDVRPYGGKIPSSKMQFTVSQITEISREAGTNKAIIERVTVYVDYEWLSMPAVKKEDGITINWDGNVFVPADNSFSFVDYQMGFDDEWHQGTSTSNPAEFQDGGLGFSFSLVPYQILGGNCYGYKGHGQIGLLPKVYPTYSENNLSSSYMQTSFSAIYVHSTALFGDAVFSFQVTDNINVSFLFNSDSYDSISATKTLKYSR